MINSIAWKNIWRNKVRSLVVIVALTLGLIGGIFSVAMMVGMIEQRVRMAINNEVSHIQLHNPKFRENNEIQYVIPQAQNIVEELESDSRVKSVTSRIKIMAMGQTSKTGTGVIINGIEPEKEKLVSDIYKMIKDSADVIAEKGNIDSEKLKKYLRDSCGSYFETKRKYPVLISRKLSEKLKVKVRSKIVFTFQNINGTITGGTFRVVGIYKTKNTMFDETNVFVKREDLASLASLNASDAHEIALMAKDPENVEVITEDYKNKYTKYKLTESSILALKNAGMEEKEINKLKSFTGNSEMSGNKFRSQITSVIGEDKFNEFQEDIEKNAETGVNLMSWGELSPDLSMMTDWVSLMLYIFIGIILLALGFGIVNTMLMVVLERVKELGMLMAIGMNKARVFSMILLETVFLSLTGAFIGMGLSIIIVSYFMKNGIDLSKMYGEAFEAIGYDAFIYPQFEWNFYFQITIMVILTGIIASIYPAWKAIKLNPAEAIRSE